MYVISPDNEDEKSNDNGNENNPRNNSFYHVLKIRWDMTKWHDKMTGGRKDKGW